jgi:hypothetical protein
MYALNGPKGGQSIDFREHRPMPWQSIMAILGLRALSMLSFKIKATFLVESTANSPAKSD